MAARAFLRGGDTGVTENDGAGAGGRGERDYRNGFERGVAFFAAHIGAYAVPHTL